MFAPHHRAEETTMGKTAQTTTDERTSTSTTRGKVRYLLGSLRLVMGGIFLWAFLDKLLGLGFATGRESAWIHGGSPTNGFLTFGTSGPLAEVFQAIAGHPVADALFMLGLLGIGLALVLGIGMRVAAVAGATMMMLMWAAALPPANNPVLDDHIVYALVLVLLAAAEAGRTWGLGTWWAGLDLVQRHGWLR